MNFIPGTILISSPSLQDPHFDKVVILITEYNKNGAMGFVINKLFPRVFNELVEFKNSSALPLYEGGPVENESLYFLHRCPDLIKEGVQVIDTLYMGGNFKQAVIQINNKVILPDDIKLFIGYCGWDAGQLEQEIDEGSWLLYNTDSQIIFSNSIDMLWQEIYERINN